MDNMCFESILIADTDLKTAKYEAFKLGLNIVTGSKSKVGKSILLKSLYHTFGANVGLAEAWGIESKLFIVSFDVNGEKYRIARKGKQFAIFRGDDNSARHLSTTDELAKSLAEIFGFGIHLYIANKSYSDSDLGEMFSIYLNLDRRIDEIRYRYESVFDYCSRDLFPDKHVFRDVCILGECDRKTAPSAFTFLPYYIDQDKGWDTLYGGVLKHSNYKYKIEDWMKALYYHLGQYTDEAIKLEFKKCCIGKTIRELSEYERDIESLISTIYDEIKISKYTVDESRLEHEFGRIENNVKGIVRGIDDRRSAIHRNQILLERHKLQLEILVNSQSNSSIQEKESIVEVCSCPKCGYVYDKEILDLVRENFCKTSERGLKEHIQRVINDIEESIKQDMAEYFALVHSLESLGDTHLKGESSYDGYLEYKGKKALKTRLELNLQLLRDVQEFFRYKERDINNELAINIHQTLVEDWYKEFVKSNLVKLKVWDDGMASRMNEINLLKAIKTKEDKGISSSKAMIAQYFGFFQIMESLKSTAIRFPFVVDPPHGKEVNQEISKDILKIVGDTKLFQQVIIATTDFEDYKRELSQVIQEAHVILLTQPNKLLNKDDYREHREMIDKVLELLNV